MNSNLQKIYNKMNYGEMLNKRTYLLSSNPFYKVNNFIINIDKGLNKNYIKNLIDLIITQEKQTGYTSDYDYKNNKIYSKDSKSDIYGLLHVASNDREKEYTGIITPEGIGYGLNNGLTEYYTNSINNKKIVYPIETLIAKIFDSIEHRAVAIGYFNNDSQMLLLSDSEIIKIMELLDFYHDNYIELLNLYKEKFDKERYFHNEVYGKYLKSNNINLQEIYSKINKLEYKNTACMYEIYRSLIMVIRRSCLEKNEQDILIEYMNGCFKNIFKNENFNYLSNLTTKFEKTPKRRILSK